MKSCFHVLVLTVAFGAVCGADQTFWAGSLPPTPQARAAQVREWLRGFKQLDQRLPTLSPAERAWLKTEYDDQISEADGKFTPRALAAGDSVEYHKRIAREGIERLLSDLNALSASVGRASSTETLAWTQLVADMMDPPFWQSVAALRTREVFSGDINGVNNFFLENHTMWARLVLIRVVVPMLSQPARR